MKIEDVVMTKHGKGIIRVIDNIGPRRYGVKHDIYPDKFSKGEFNNDILYYFPHEIKLIPGSQ